MRASGLLALALALSSLAAAPADARKAETTLERIARTGAVTIGYREDAPPFSYAGGPGEPRGYSIDVCGAIVEEVRSHLKRPDLEMRFAPVTAETRFDSVAEGLVDIECGITTLTLARREAVDFTSIVFVTGGGLMTRPKLRVETLADLKRRSIAVPRGTTIEAGLARALAEAGVKARIVPVVSISEGLARLRAGAVDALAEDRMVLIGLAATEGLMGRVGLPPLLFSYEPYAFAVRQNDAAFRLVADRALAKLFRTGAIYDIYEKWLGTLGAEPSQMLINAFALQAVPD